MRFSALQRAENSSMVVDRESKRIGGRRFSALQRAENSSMEYRTTRTCPRPKFQCSSASRKFLNTINLRGQYVVDEFQCSSASRKFLNFHGSAARPRRTRVSVLFSEPKIPQSICDGQAANVIFRFSALQRAENSSIMPAIDSAIMRGSFQCSSASRKFLNPDPRTCVHPYFRPRRSRFVIPEPSWCVAMTPVY